MLYKPTQKGYIIYKISVLNNLKLYSKRVTLQFQNTNINK